MSPVIFIKEYNSHSFHSLGSQDYVPFSLSSLEANR